MFLIEEVEEGRGVYGGESTESGVSLVKNGSGGNGSLGVPVKSGRGSRKNRSKMLPTRNFTGKFFWRRPKEPVADVPEVYCGRSAMR